MSDEYWLENPVAQMIGRLPRRDVAIDVGANEGTWTQSLSPVFGTVYAIEPDERACSRIPNLGNVRLIRGCVADSTDMRTIFLRPGTGQNSLLREHPIGAGGMSLAPVLAEQQVQCFSMDDLFPGGADFVKMDIEGGEVMALRGMQDASRWRRTAMVVECHDTFTEVVAEMRRLGKNVSRVPHPLPAAHPGHCWAVGE